MTPVDDLEQKAMRLGALAAIRSEKYAAAHPEEIARRRLFFRRLLEECRPHGSWQRSCRAVEERRQRGNYDTAVGDF